MDDGLVPAQQFHSRAGPGRTLLQWLLDGLGAAFFCRPLPVDEAPRPAQLLALLALCAALQLGLGRLEVPGPAVFDLRGWLIPWWTVAAAVLLVWGVSVEARLRPHTTAAWLALWAGASLPPLLAGEALAIAQAHEQLPPLLQAVPAIAWMAWLALQVWIVALGVFAGHSVGLRRSALALLAAGLATLQALAVWQFDDRAWLPLEEPTPQLALSQATFEEQQALWERSVAALPAQRPGVVDVYGIVFAPYATEDVFLRESALVADVLAERFDARGRVLRLVNHVRTADTLPWATPANLERALEAVAARMDRQEDVLVVYLTSHGGADYQLAAAHPPLQVPWLTPMQLREALDRAGIRNRVLAISACYSGGWTGPLAGPTTLVMTAADAQHTSYGCGHRSELTFFGRALFDEQLRRTRSFEEAFTQAVPVIRRREEEAGKPDGFSNPQMQVGEQLRPVLARLEQQLGQGR